MNIREAAVSHLATRSRTCGEMRMYLLKKGFDEAEIEKTVSELKELNYLNDLEYVIAYLNYGFTKGKGIKLIKYELSDLDVDRDTIEDGIAVYEEEYGISIEEEETERAFKEAMKVAGDSEIDDKIKARAARRLSSKGYGSETVFRVLEMLGKQDI